jgi:signal transduction histidine kinase
MSDRSLELYQDNKTQDFTSILQAPGLIFLEMKVLNLLILFFITIISLHALRGYTMDGSALHFLIGAGSVPAYSWKLPLCVAALCICLLLLLSVPCNNHPELVAKIVIEYGIILGICTLTGFGYTGIVMLLLADTMRYRIDWKKRIIYIVAICIAYLAMSGNKMYSLPHVIPLSQMWAYYRQDVRNSLLSVLDMLSLLNTMIFILYMVVMTLSQTSEKERILRLNSQLQMANRKLEEYAQEQVRMTETRERNRLAREIHDTLGHSLTGIITGIEACIMLMDIAPEATKEQLRAIAEVARNGITDVRHSVNALRPDALETLSLESAIRKLVEESEKSTGVKIDLVFPENLQNLDQDEEDVLYRIVQESITNAIRHGKATHIDVRMEHVDNDLRIRIADNGKGCDNIQSGFGLHHMQERIDMLKGTLSYSGKDGFVIEAVVPIRVVAEEES